MSLAHGLLRSGAWPAVGEQPTLEPEAVPAARIAARCRYGAAIWPGFARANARPAGVAAALLDAMPRCAFTCVDSAPFVPAAWSTRKLRARWCWVVCRQAVPVITESWYYQVVCQALLPPGWFPAWRTATQPHRHRARAGAYSTRSADAPERRSLRRSSSLVLFILDDKVNAAYCGRRRGADDTGLPDACSTRMRWVAGRWRTAGVS